MTIDDKLEMLAAQLTDQKREVFSKIGEVFVTTGSGGMGGATVTGAIKDIGLLDEKLKEVAIARKIVGLLPQEE